MIAAWRPQTIPFSSLGSSGSVLEQFAREYSYLLKTGCIGLWLIHVAEAIYVVRLCRQMEVTMADTAKWVLQTVLLGIWSTRLVKREANEIITRGASHRWRDSNQQQQYRRHSSSKVTDGKDVAHTLSLELADKIAEGLKLDDNKMKALLNHFDNFSLVNQSINRSEHRVIDKNLAKKYISKEALTTAEKDRAKRQLRFLRKHEDKCPAKFLNRARKFYKALGVE
eukprot:Em0021g851a